MDAKELAQQLNGIEYPCRINKELIQQAKEDGLVIVYGASDDLMEFDGAFRSELDAYNGTTAYITSDGLLVNHCDDDDCPYFGKAKKAAVKIKAVWSDDEGPCWSFETSIPHETFEVVEDGEPYCRGIVFALADVKVAG